MQIIRNNIPQWCEWINISKLLLNYGLTAVQWYISYKCSGWILEYKAESNSSGHDEEVVLAYISDFELLQRILGAHWKFNYNINTKCYKLRVQCLNKFTVDARNGLIFFPKIFLYRILKYVHFSFVNTVGLDAGLLYFGNALLI